MKLKKLISVAAAAVLLSGAAQAATTYKYIEGDRNDVIGAERLVPNGTGTGDTVNYDLDALGSYSALGGGDVLEIYGRIIGFADDFTFTSNRNFRVTWIFDGYTTAEDGFVSKSGFVANPFDDTQSAPAQVTMDPGGIMGIDNPFFTNICSDPGNCNTEIKVFSQVFDSGTWSLNIDGLAGGSIDSYYEIRVTAIPLPAGGLLLLSALGGLGLARRRRK